MTIIVYRDGIIAGDTAAWSCDVLVGYHPKVFRTPDGWLFGCSGSLREILKIQEWMMGGQVNKPPTVRESSIMAISPDGVIRIASELSKMEFYAPGVPHFVIGMGHEFARGCLAAGASAEETVRLAIKHIPWVGGEVTTESLFSRSVTRKCRLLKRKGG